MHGLIPITRRSGGLSESHPGYGSECRGLLHGAGEILDRLLAKRQGTFDIPEAKFVVDQDLSMESRDAAIGDVVAQRFDEMLFMEDPIDLQASV